MFLRKEVEAEEPEEIVIYEPDMKPIYRKDFTDTSVIISLDCSASQRATLHLVIQEGTSWLKQLKINRRV